MNYRRLGDSGLKVSQVGLGSWLTYDESAKQTNAEACIHKAYELGVNFFDTANVYNYGEAERVVGKALRNYPRDSYVLASKVYFPMGDGPNDRGLSRKHIMEQCDATLKRLGVDYLDLYQCHRYDRETPTEETLLALDDLVRQGKIFYYGTSEWSAAQLTEAVHITTERKLHPIVSNQPIYNMLVRYVEKEVIPTSQKNGIGQVVFSPLAQGVLSGKYKPGQALPNDSRAADNHKNQHIKKYLTDNVLKHVQILETIAGDLGITLSQLAIAWILHQPSVSSAIAGASRPSQVVENVQAADIELTDDTLSEIETVLSEINQLVPDAGDLVDKA